jgi:hypothetical protein
MFDTFQVLCQSILRFQAFPHHLHTKQHGSQRRIQVMGSARRHLAHARQFFEFNKAVPQSYAFAYIGRHFQQV